MPFFAFSRRLELGPARQRLVGVLGVHLAEDVRMPVDQLAHDAVDHVVDAEGAFGVAQLGLEDHLQEQVAQLLAVVGDRAALQGVHDLVGFLDEVGQKGGQRLLAIPGAAVGRQQPLHEAHEAGQVSAGLLSRQGRKVDGRGRCFVAHGRRV